MFPFYAVLQHHVTCYVFHHQAVHKTFHNLLLLNSIFDMVKCYHYQMFCCICICRCICILKRHCICRLIWYCISRYICISRSVNVFSDLFVFLGLPSNKCALVLLASALLVPSSPIHSHFPPTNRFANRSHWNGNSLRCVNLYLVFF